MRHRLLTVAGVVLALDPLGTWQRWFGIDPIASGLALGLAAFLA